MPYLPTVPITITFRHGTADLASDDWTKNLFCNGTAKGNTIDVIQVIDNYYKATFTPDSAATWDLHLEENSERHHFTFKVDSEETLQLIRLHVARIDQQTRN